MMTTMTEQEERFVADGIAMLMHLRMGMPATGKKGVSSSASYIYNRWLTPDRIYQLGQHLVVKGLVKADHNRQTGITIHELTDEGAEEADGFLAKMSQEQ